MFSDLRVRFRTLFRRTAVTQEIDQELQFHLQQQMEKYLQAGFTREQARHRARLQFGGLTQITEDCMEARGVSFVEHIGQDVRYAMRMFGRTPGFTAVVVVTLALGIGANTAVFSLINAVLLKMLPVKDPEQLVKLSKIQPVSGPNDYFSYPEVERFQRATQAFSAVFAFANLGGVNVEASLFASATTPTIAYQLSAIRTPGNDPGNSSCQRPAPVRSGGRVICARRRRTSRSSCGA